MLTTLGRIARSLKLRQPRKSLLERTAVQIGSLSVAHRPILQFASNSDLHDKGYISNGARNTLAPGKYVVTYEFHVDDDAYSPRLVFDAVRWITETQATVVAEAVASLLPGAARVVVFHLAFELAELAVVEVRAWSDANGSRVGLKRVRIDVVELPSNFEAHIAFNPSTGKQKLWPYLPVSIAPVCAVPRYAAAETSEIWFQVPAGAKGAAIIHLEDATQDHEIIEIGDVQSAAYFQLRESGDKLSYYKIQPSVNNRLMGELRGSLRIGGYEVPVPSIQLSRMFEKPRIRSTSIESPSGRHVIVQRDGEGRGEVRLLRWYLRRNHRHTPHVEGRDLVVPQLTADAVDLGRADIALLVFEKSQEAGAIRISFGGQSAVFDLQSATPGIRAILLPRDFDDVRLGGTSAVAQKNALRCEVIATGLKNSKSNNSEVIIKHVWSTYPVAKGMLDSMQFSGSLERSADVVKMWEGTASIEFNPRVAIGLHRHDWSGLALLRCGEREWIVDLYSDHPEQILFFPNLDRPLIDPRDEQSQIGKNPVHPALKGLFHKFHSQSDG